MKRHDNSTKQKEIGKKCEVEEIVAVFSKMSKADKKRIYLDSQKVIKLSKEASVPEEENRKNNKLVKVLKYARWQIYYGK